MSNSEKASLPQRKKLGHEIGKAAAEKSRGLFSADDWQCGRCGNVNWARRQQCNMCNAPKFGEVEERTGLGGGYNERENVEYIERVESDGEYDDFGRKKKKYRGNEDGSDNNESERDVLPDVVQIITKLTDAKKKEEENGEEEEDDDDDEDGDLSKYDLLGWGDNSSEKDEGRRSPSASSASSRSSGSQRSRSSSYSSQSSRSASPSSSDSEKPARPKRTHSRSRSSSPEKQSTKKRKGSSPASARRPVSRDRSESNSSGSHHH